MNRQPNIAYLLLILLTLVAGCAMSAKKQLTIAQEGLNAAGKEIIQARADGLITQEQLKAIRPKYDEAVDLLFSLQAALPATQPVDAATFEARLAAYQSILDAIHAQINSSANTTKKAP